MSSINIDSKDLIRLQETLELATFSIEKTRTLVDFIIESGFPPSDVLPQTVSLDQMLKKMFNSSDYWSGNSAEGISIPIGCDSKNNIVDLKLGFDTGDYYASLLGRPGYGKTVLLHSIICSASVCYSPNQLQFFLFDNSKVRDFSFYERLPHVNTISFGVEGGRIQEVLQAIEEELNSRIQLFRDLGEKTNRVIDSFESFRLLSDFALPRLLLIVNDFDDNDFYCDDFGRNKAEIEHMLINIMINGRKFGVHIILSSVIGRFSPYKGLITKSVTFNSNDCTNNTTRYASGLSIGEAFMNIKENGKDGIIKFRCAFSKDYLRFVDFVTTLYSQTFQ
ncbi:MAG: hypothetical protein II829_03160 [Bacteroidales bacterium]|nr:hypothetical protein [Bacteroidales bacterium]